MLPSKMFVGNSNVIRLTNGIYRQFCVTPMKKHQDMRRKSETTSYKPIPDQVIQKFAASYPNFVKSILDDEALKGMSGSDKRQIKEMMDYNILAGYSNMPYFMLSTYHTLEKPENITEQKQDLVNLMAWYIQMAQSGYHILDDIADGSETRSQKPCWYRRPDIGLNAVIDGLLLTNLFPNLIRRQFSSHHNYIEFVELFHQMDVMCGVGERIQFIKCNWDDMTIDRWMKITYHKISWNQSILPFKIALLLTEIYDEDKFERIKPILLEFGLLLQMINDLLEAFPKKDVPVGNPTDIQNGRCSWLLVHALKFSEPSQRRIIKRNYGIKDVSAIKRVLDIYSELGLKEYGQKSIEQLYQEITDRIEKLPEDYPKQALKNGLLIAYKGY